MEIIVKKIEEIIPYENNPRRNDEAVDYVAKSIKEFGFKVPIIIDKDNVIVTGHTRLKAAKKLGFKEVPCIMADDLSDEQIKAFRLADNKVGEFSEWDIDLLNVELDNIFNIDMNNFGFNFDLEPLENELDRNDDEIEKKEYQVKLTFKEPKDFKKIEDNLREYLEKVGADNISVNGGYI